VWGGGGADGWTNWARSLVAYSITWGRGSKGKGKIDCLVELVSVRRERLGGPGAGIEGGCMCLPSLVSLEEGVPEEE